MGNLRRRKGRRFEQEIAALIRERLGVAVSRNLSQYQQRGQSDLNGLPGWSIECKRHAAMTDSELAAIGLKLAHRRKLAATGPF